MFGFGADIHEAAQAGNVNKLHKLLKKGVDPNQLDKRGVTPIFYTANTGSVECAQLLVDYGADINFAVTGGGTPLHSALLKKHDDLAYWMVFTGANVNASTDAGVTPLHLAAQMGLAGTMLKILEDGADINALTKKGQSALFLALYGMYSQNNDNTAALTLFDMGADPRLPAELELHLAKLVELRPDLANTLKYGLNTLVKNGCDPEIEDYAKRMLKQLYSVEEPPEREAQGIESPLLGHMEAGEFDTWWKSRALQIPLWGNKELPIYYEFDPDDDPDFLTEADAAVQNFLKKGPEALHESTRQLDWNFKACSEILDDEVTPDMLTDWQRELLDYEDRNRLWEHVGAPGSIFVKRRSRRDKDIYVYMICSCEWEEEHGLQLVFRRGLMLTKLSQYDGHCTWAEAMGIADEEDELLSEFNRKYGH